MKKKLMLNTVSSLALQAVTVICGFILPRLILQFYGSEVNGLVQSITQFLGIITLAELGIGQVIQSSLYKPIAKKDNDGISCVVSSGEKFFRKIAIILLFYVAVLVVFYPYIINDSHDWLYIATLVLAISISSFAQYYFGIIDKILLNADQRGYIHYFSQIVVLVINTVACVILVKCGATIQLVKLVTSILFLIRPIAVRLYINKFYALNRKIRYTEEPIKQKWNGMVQHIAAFVLDGTDNIVLTLFSTLQSVSIYSVYNIVIYGLRQLYQSAIAGVHSIIGELWAKKEIERLNKIFGFVEITLHFSTVFLFGCTAVLILPFVEVYTYGITDVQYIQPTFAYLIIAAHTCTCLKSTYNMLILAGGHYKQTQKCHIVTATLNIVISVVGVIFWGIVGVALGTLISMAYQLVWMAYYTSQNLLKWPFKNFLKQICLDLLIFALIFFTTSWIKMSDVTYLQWFVMALKVASISFVVVLCVLFLFYRSQITQLFKYIFKRFKS